MTETIKRKTKAQVRKHQQAAQELASSDGSRHDFTPFADAISAQIAMMSEHPLLVVGVNVDEMFAHYLASFPDGTNNVFRERGEYDCSCCKHFIRDIGNLVALVNGKLISIWDVSHEVSYPFDVVSESMSKYILDASISSQYYSWQGRYGSKQTKELYLEDGDVKKPKYINWNHFHCDSPAAVTSADMIGGLTSTSIDRYKTLVRSCSEISYDSLEVVSELIDDKNLYMHANHKGYVDLFKSIHQRYNGIESDADKDLYAWSVVVEHERLNTNLKSSLIGTLISDISEGMEVEQAVSRYESKAAPQNYKRPKKIHTKKQVEEALKVIDELNLRSSLQRRHANISDVSPTDIYFSSNRFSSAMESDDPLKAMLDSAAAEASTPVVAGGVAGMEDEKGQDVDISKFINEIAPSATSIKAYFDNNHMNNLVNLTTAQDSSAEPLFKWQNNSAWSYIGELASSSIDQLIQSRGGDVEDALLAVMLEWYARDDLDIHVITPNMDHVHHSNKLGCLQVDENVSGSLLDPIEYVRFNKGGGLFMDGVYTIIVHNYTERWYKGEDGHDGFAIRIRSIIDGRDQLFKCAKMPASRLRRNTSRHKHEKMISKSNYGKTSRCYGHEVPLTAKSFIDDNRYGYHGPAKECMKILVKGGKIVGIRASEEMIYEGELQQEIWGLKTKSLVDIDCIVNSPNHWQDSSDGEKHTFFVISGCKNTENSVRGFYPQFLREALYPHRRTFESLSSQMIVKNDDSQQMAGLGFVEGKKDKLKVIVDAEGGSRYYNVHFS